LCGDGGATGGYGVYVRDGRLHYTHNFLGLHQFTVAAEVPVPRGEHRLRVEFTATGRFKGDVALYYDDLPVGAGQVPATVPVFYGLSGFTVGYVRGTSPVPGLEAPCRVTPGALVRVVVELDPRSWRDPGRADAAVRGSAASPLPQDDRAGLGTQ
jgi:arylsulfatase